MQDIDNFTYILQTVTVMKIYATQHVLKFMKLLANALYSADQQSYRNIQIQEDNDLLSFQEQKKFKLQKVAYTFITSTLTYHCIYCTCLHDES
jgi:hypothetical protein